LSRQIKSSTGLCLQKLFCVLSSRLGNETFERILRCLSRDIALRNDIGIDVFQAFFIDKMNNLGWRRRHNHFIAALY
jgi:hypothetical protein